MKPQHFAAVAGFLLLASLVLVLTSRPADRNGNQAPSPARVVTVTGEGEVRVKPDTMLVTFGVNLHRASAVDAEKQALEVMAQVRTAVVEAGAEEDRTELSVVTLTPDTYQDFSGTVRISGFQARGGVQVLVRHLSRAQDVLDAGLGAGATSVDSVQYTLAAAETSRQAAMKVALENARERASILARAEGERLGSLQSMEVLLEDAPTGAATPGGLVYLAKVKATFKY